MNENLGRTAAQRNFRRHQTREPTAAAQHGKAKRQGIPRDRSIGSDRRRAGRLLPDRGTPPLRRPSHGTTSGIRGPQQLASSDARRMAKVPGLDDWLYVPRAWYEADPVAFQARADFVLIYEKGSARQITEALETIWAML